MAAFIEIAKQVPFGGWKLPRTPHAVLATLSLLPLSGLAFDAATTKGWTECGALLGFLLIGVVVFRVVHDKLPLLATLFTFTMLLNALGWVFEFYAKGPGFDEVAHGLTTTALTGLSGYACFRSLLSTRAIRPWQLAIMVLSLGIAIGALWEICEWFMYLMTGRPGIIKSLNDTVSDLIWDTLGSTLALPLLWRDAMRPLDGDDSRRVGLFQEKWVAALATATAAMWVVAENRGDDAMQVDGKREMVAAYQDGREVETTQRLSDEDLYAAFKANPAAYAGKKLIFKKTISAILGPTTIRIDADGLVGSSELVVDLKKGMLPVKATVGDQIEILGTIELSTPGGAVEPEPVVKAESILDHAGDE